MTNVKKILSLAVTGLIMSLPMAHSAEAGGGVSFGFSSSSPGYYAPPVYSQPVYAQPVYAQPVYAQPVYAQPVYVQQRPYYRPYRHHPRAHYAPAYYQPAPAYYPGYNSTSFSVGGRFR